MKYIKRLALNRKDQQSNRFAVEADDRIVTTSKVSLQLPAGATSDRPSPNNGQIRYNNTINDTEIYNISGSGTGWERVKTNRQGTITPQNLGVGNYINTVFGPLSYNVATNKPQNVLTFIDNVFQIPTTNYSLELGSSIGVTRNASGDYATGTSVITLSSVADILIGEVVTAGPGLLAVGTTVTNIVTSTNTISINPVTTGNIADGTTLTFSTLNGTDVYIKFTSPAPAKQVFALLGFDGYSP